MPTLSKFRIWSAMAVTALAMTTAGVAQAATLVATYTGKVDELVDVTGAFGAPGARLGGEAFVATFIYDPSLGAIGPSKMDGGPYWGLPPMMTATLLINGKTVVFDEYESRVEVFPDYIQHYISGSAGWLGLRLNFANTADYFSTLPLSVGAGPPASSALISNNVAYAFRLQADTLQITSAVPEPGVWALMIVGFGLAGAALRHRPLTAAAR